MKQQLRKPENWQDFEELCKILWSDIWNCPEIKMNGRSGQNQHGVDVYGVPKNESGYFGIQCKGKDEYIHAQLTQKEVDSEIEKAKNFKPILKKFYFTTTANKDVAIEEYIRIKDIENRENGSFEIHLFCWEDIVSLIDQSRKTHDWYVKKINFQTQFDVEVTFNDDTKFKEFEPVLIKNHIKYRHKKKEYGFYPGAIDPTTKHSPEVIKKEKLEVLQDIQPIRHFINGTSINKSTCVFFLKIKNTGNNALENFKLYITVSNGDNINYGIVSKRNDFFDNNTYKYNWKFNIGTNVFEFIPLKDILVQEDTVTSDKICVRPNDDSIQQIVIKWKFIAKDFSKSGELILDINPIIKEQHVTEDYEYINTIPTIESEVRFENYTGKS